MNDDRLISLNAAIDAFKKELTVGESKGNYVTICSVIGYEGAKHILESLPTVDAVPVVRCRECKWFEDANEDCGTCGFFDGARSANHYCGEGERKDGERHGR